MSIFIWPGRPRPRRRRCPTQWVPQTIIATTTPTERIDFTTCAPRARHLHNADEMVHSSATKSRPGAGAFFRLQMQLRTPLPPSPIGAIVQRPTARNVQNDDAAHACGGTVMD